MSCLFHLPWCFQSSWMLKYVRGLLFSVKNGENRRQKLVTQDKTLKAEVLSLFLLKAGWMPGSCQFCVQASYHLLLLPWRYTWGCDWCCEMFWLPQPPLPVSVKSLEQVLSKGPSCAAWHYHSPLHLLVSVCPSPTYKSISTFSLKTPPLQSLNVILYIQETESPKQWLDPGLVPSSFPESYPPPDLYTCMMERKILMKPKGSPEFPVPEIKLHVQIFLLIHTESYNSAELSWLANTFS